MKHVKGINKCPWVDEVQIITCSEVGGFMHTSWAHY